MDQVLNQVTKAITSALAAPHPRYPSIRNALLYLAKLENRPWWLTKIAYDWCAVIWENRRRYRDWEFILFLSLEVGFRCLDPLKRWYLTYLTHTKHHQELADVVFKSKKLESIADLLWTLTVCDNCGPAIKSFGVYKQYIVDLQDIVTEPFSPRLRRLIMDSVALIGYRGFREVGTERFVGLLNHLSIGVQGTVIPVEWGSILLETAQSPEGHRHLVIQSWELLVELATSRPWKLSGTAYTPHVTDSLLGSEEWDKLECWIGVVWMMWSSEIDIGPEDLKHAMESLFRQRPDSVRKLTQLMKRWSEGREADVPENFERICGQAREEAS